MSIKRPIKRGTRDVEIKFIDIPQTGTAYLIDDELDGVPSGNTITVTVGEDSLPVYYDS